MTNDDNGTNSGDKQLVFISYSHKDEDWKDRLRPHLDMFTHDRELTIWDDRQIEPTAEWYDDIQEVMAKAAVAVCLISPDYLASDFCRKEEIPYLLERRNEEGMRLFLVLLRPCAWQKLPWLAALQLLPRDGKAIASHFKDDWDTPFAEVATYIIEALETSEGVAVEERRREIAPTKPLAREIPWPLLADDLIEIERLPATGAELFGRQAELALLDEAWAAESTNVVSLVAWGGVGKSTLVNKWLERLKADNYRGAARVFGWSFYSQGTSERVTSADQFIAEALAWFGDKNPAAGSPWAKGERLAELVRSEKTLLVLDGLEPLQDPYQGLKDPSVQRLVEELARDNAGLCLITTRERVRELDDFPEETQQQDLEQISPEAGRALLRVKGVRGSDAELESASRAFGNHALAINLLANYLRDIEGHHVQHAAEIPDLDIPEKEGRHPRRLMAAFAKRFGEGPEVEVLRLLGLFDRPATKGAIEALRAPPPIAHLTEQICRQEPRGLAGWWQRLTESNDAPSADLLWDRLLESLRKAGLVAPEGHHGEGEIDAHPLVREHFGAELRERDAEAWRVGHGRLYEHFKSLPEKEQPDTLEEMAPLFQSVFHGCQADRRQEVLDDIYYARITRSGDAYAIRRFAAIGSDLAAVAGFFAQPFVTPADNVVDAAKGYILNQAGFDLRALGRLREAIEPMEAGLERAVAQDEWPNAATGASNLSELHLTLGEVAKAAARAEESVAHADQSGDAFQRMGKRTTLAAARHQAGERERALALFEQAEALQAESQPEYPRLFSLAGFRYCDLLLDLGQQQEVRKRVAQTLEWVLARDQLGAALERLSLGRAELMAWQADQSGDLAMPVKELNQAVDGLRQAGQILYLPWGLLARAALSRMTGEVDRAWRDLEEVRRIAKRSEMRLFECDAHLEAARLHLAQTDSTRARAELDQAKALIDATGYHRRDRDVEEIEAHLARP